MLSGAIATAINGIAQKLKGLDAVQDRHYQFIVNDADFIDNVYYNPLDSVELEEKKPFNGIVVTNFSGQRVTLKLNNVNLRVPAGAVRKLTDYPIQNLYIVKSETLDDEIEIVLSKELTAKEIIRNL